MNTARENTIAARALIGGLAAAGVRHAVITPGSRSTPLVFALADQDVITPYLVIDERSAGFFALGLARKTGRPVPIACTSGTAVANLFPAIAEANLSRVPVIALTADRPPRLREVGAAQTIDQVHLFGRHVRWSIDLPVPGPGPVATGFEAAGTRAVQAAMAGLPGPVQVNVPFDEPLVEPPADHPGAYVPPAGELSLPEFPVSRMSLDRVASLLRSARRPLIIAGPETGGLPARALLRLADALSAPVLADPLSGLRAGVPDGAPVLDAFDAWLRSAPPLPPDFVLRFGAAPTSKVLNQLLAAWSDAVHVLVDLPGGYREPNGTRSIVLPGSPSAVAEALALVPARAEAGWCERWLAADRAARTALDAASREECEPFEGRVFTELRDLLPPGATLVAGNSMPVRDLDNFFGIRPDPLDITANRGANGIDGVMSSAAGAAAAGAPTAVVVGDVSFLHDLNALWAAREHRLPLLVVVVNNGGGGIFHYLPQVAHTDAFERWFATPPGIEPARAAALFDLPFCRAESWPAFCEAVESWVQAPAPFVVEVRTDRRANVAMHQRVWAAAARAAAEVLGR
ncbi:MAG: 2-succinyl-5-enolpyruvyl-6-hydroxy-3-cyclohexene-1-carboxylic-acid synthase [Dehalococcoidia bacterium]|nr:2-succinyl-5-enolpyruvyl-6-hydroxy-3-cyclohexene-1-carboxylic-acid synthase [Dehalococcoidia bacterium]